MIPFSMVRQRIVWSSCLTMLFLMSSTMITSYYLPIYFQAVRNATPTLSGVYNLPAIISSILAAIISGVLGASDIHDTSQIVLVALHTLDTDRNCSWQTWILSTLVHRRCNSAVDWHWPNFDI